jgi:conjugative transfer pilus assembly protein TraH
MLLKGTQLLFLLLVMPPLAIAADVKKQMLHFLDEVMASSNYSSADIYQGQKAGYVTGGSYTVRSNSMNLNPATVTLPKYEAGCGGIDIYTGGFSFVNDEQLIQALKSIGSASAGYAFMLAMETVSPQMASTMKQMQTWANNMNTMSINSCETAAQLVGSVWPKNDIASSHICQAIGTDSSYISDRVSARHQCKDYSGRKDIKDKAQDQNPDLSFDYNVAWNAIKLQGTLVEDENLAELLMTLMGTVIVHDESAEVFPSKASEEAFIRTLVEGGKNTIYSCDEQKKCLHVTSKSIIIKQTESWAGRVEELLLSVQRKILSDEELTFPEIELISKSRIPLYKYMAILTAYKKSVCPVEIKQMADVVAIDVLSRFLRESLDSVRRACSRLRENVAYANKIDSYLDSLEYVERSLSNYELRSARLMEQEHSVFVKMDMLEKYIAKELHL